MTAADRLDPNQLHSKQLSAIRRVVLFSMHFAELKPKLTLSQNTDRKRQKRQRTEQNERLARYSRQVPDQPYCKSLHLSPWHFTQSVDRSAHLSQALFSEAILNSFLFNPDYHFRLLIRGNLIRQLHGISQNAIFFCCDCHIATMNPVGKFDPIG